MELEDVLFRVWVVFMIFIPLALYFSGKNVLKLFPEVTNDDIQFKERWCSGYSGMYTRRANGAKNILMVMVVKNEFWIKSHPIHALAIEKSGILTKIPIE